jgi:hypothetical protein
LRDRILRRLGARLGKFAVHIERLTVRFEDVNGPRGGIDVRCTIKVVISGLPSVVVTELAKTTAEASDRAGDRVERVVRRAIGRSRELERGRLVRARPRTSTARRTPARAPRQSGTRASTADRNRKQRTRKATVALEGSARSRPSRKSTRSSVNRVKHGNKLTRRERRRVSSPTARRARASRAH